MTTNNKIQGLNASSQYTTQFINRNFLIKVYAHKSEYGQSINRLVGVHGAIELVGVELFDKFVTRALKAGQDCVTCKLRRGLQLSFYAH